MMRSPVRPWSLQFPPASLRQRSTHGTVTAVLRGVTYMSNPHGAPGMSERHRLPYDSVIDMIGWTPLVRLNSVVDGCRTPVYGKCEFMNPGGSVKDRIGLAMIEAAEDEGSLKPGGTVVAVDFVPHQHEWMREELGVSWLGFSAEEVAGWFLAVGLIDFRLEEHAGFASNRDLPATFIASGRQPS